MIRRPSGTITIIAINVIIFFIPQFIQGLDMKMLAWFALFFPKNDFFEIWQFISSMFMHGGPAHLFFNMFALFSFGSILEVRWGLKKFLTFYLVVGIGAGAIYTAVNYAQFIVPYNQLVDASVPATDIKAYFNYSRPSFKMLAAMPAEELLELRNIYNTPVVGASGAIYGILVAFGILYPNAKLMLIFLPIPVAAKYFISGLLLFDLFSGITGYSIFVAEGGGIAHFAHIGGAIIGFLLMWFWGSLKTRATDYNGSVFQ